MSDVTRILSQIEQGDPQAADGHAGGGGAELRVARQVPREDDAVDVRCRHLGWLLSTANWLSDLASESTAALGWIWADTPVNPQKRCEVVTDDG